MNVDLIKKRKKKQFQNAFFINQSVFEEYEKEKEQKKTPRKILYFLKLRIAVIGFISTP